MMAHSPYVSEVTAARFEQEVLARSHQVPVLTDFWAAWCGPCQMLMPVLARLAEEYQGKFFLAKVDTDAEQALATRFGVRSLPTVKLFRNGEVADEFMGVQPERTIRALLDRHIPRASDHALEALLADYAGGRVAEAIARARSLQAEDPANDRVKIELARMLFEQGDLDGGEAALKQVSVEARGQPETQALMARLEFLKLAAGAPPEPELRQRIARNPGDSDARLRLGARYVLSEQYEPALEELLEIVRRDRKFGNDAGRRTVLSVFHLLGGKGELVKRYRALLSAALN